MHPQLYIKVMGTIWDTEFAISPKGILDSGSQKQKHTVWLIVENRFEN